MSLSSALSKRTYPRSWFGLVMALCFAFAIQASSASAADTSAQDTLQDNATPDAGWEKITLKSHESTPPGKPSNWRSWIMMNRCEPGRREFPIADFTVKGTFNFGQSKIRLPVSQLNNNFPDLHTVDCPYYFNIDMDMIFVGPPRHRDRFEGTFSGTKISIPLKSWIRASWTYLGITVTCDYGSPTKTADITLTTGKSLRLSGEMPGPGNPYARLVADNFVIPAATKEPLPFFDVCKYARNNFFDNRGDVGVQVVEELVPNPFDE